MLRVALVYVVVGAACSIVRRMLYDDGGGRVPRG